MRLPHVAVLLVLSVIWGSAFMLVKVSLEEVPPLTLVAGRLSGAALFLAAAMLITGRSLPRRRAPWRIFLILGVVNNVVPFTLLSWGQQHIDSSLAAILVASMPLYVVILAHFSIDERLTLDRVLGVLIGFGGVFLLIGGDLGDLTGSGTLGQLAVLGGVLGYAIGTVFVRRYLQDADGLLYAGGQMMIGAAIMVPVALAVDRPFDLDLSLKVALAWLTLGVVASAIAYMLYFWLLRQVTATQASMVGYLIPVTAVFWGALLLDEGLGPTTFAGLALIVAGVWVVNGGGLWLSQRLRGDRGPAATEPVGPEPLGGTGQQPTGE